MNMEEISNPTGKRNPAAAFRDPACRRLWELKAWLDGLLRQNRYIARSEYGPKLQAEAKAMEKFDVMESNQLLEAYCQKNGVPFAGMEAAYSAYKRAEELVDAHNEAYLRRTMEEEKDYLDHIIDRIDPKIRLDEDQRRVVLTDEDHCLVIAGAGAGKTTTVAAKVKYLVERKGVDPSQILVVSFTNKAVQELQEKLNTDLAIPCVVSTFHAVGNAVLREHSGVSLKIVDDTKLYYVLQDYFKNSLLKNETLVDNLIRFFASYFDDPEGGENFDRFYHEIARSDLTTMRSELQGFRQEVVDRRKNKKITIQSEIVKSKDEVTIANFLYLNQIDYQYEPTYRYNIPGSKKPYTPDFILRQGGREVYLEHFGISEDGKNDRYSEKELATYKAEARTKIKHHREHGTTLLYTFTRYLDGRPLEAHLREVLVKSGFQLRPRPSGEVVKMLVETEENRYIKDLLNLLRRFISNFKTNGCTLEDFSRMRGSTDNVRTELFLSICEECYLEYERYLKSEKAIDFQDMINRSAHLLQEAKNMGRKLDWKYIIVDEYQDISRQRFDLVNAISDVSNAKIIAVGDDWQSIYAFSGSDITLFTQFKEKMGYAKLLKIVNTYRNAQEVIDIAGGFVQRNKTQITKQLRSPKSITDPVIIYTYKNRGRARRDDNKNSANYRRAMAVETALEQIMAYNKAEGKPEDSSILLLGRYGFDGVNLGKTDLFHYNKESGRLDSKNYPGLNITFMTAHSSKGLGYDNVIVINGKSGTRGFPSKYQDDPILKLVVKSDSSMDYAEERRLFYVAMTRTKNRVYFVAPERGPSEFLVELKRDYKNVSLRGEWDGRPLPDKTTGKFCPMCGYPLQLRYKPAYGLRLYICSNEPELCGFLTNDPDGGKLSIQSCEQCQDGFLIVKRSKKDGAYFLGCTNYKDDGTGCNSTISQSAYYRMFDLDATPAPPKGPPVQPEGLGETGGSPLTEPVELWRSEEHIVIKKPDIKGVRYTDLDLNDTVHTVLQCLANISEKHYYGVGVLVDVLRGSERKQIKEAGLHRTPEHCALEELDRKKVTATVEWLIENQFIAQTGENRYPVLYLAPKGKRYDETITEDALKDLLETLKAQP